MNRFRTLGPRVFLAAAVAAGAALIAACDGPSATSNDGQRAGPSVSATTPDGSTSPPATATSPSATTPSLPQGWRRCVNTVERFSVGYPGDWYTTQIRPREVCRQFHPTVFEIPKESEYPLTALNVRLVDAPPDRADTTFERVLLWEETTVAGRRAVRFETESTGEGLYLVGTRSYGYTIRFADGPISVYAVAEPGVAGYPSWKAVVDQAARTVRRP